MAEFENATIQKQRQELHLLVAELRDRDRELNEMVSSHQKQLLSWDQDRQKILSQEHRCSKLERECSTDLVSSLWFDPFRVFYVCIFVVVLKLFYWGKLKCPCLIHSVKEETLNINHKEQCEMLD